MASDEEDRISRPARRTEQASRPIPPQEDLLQPGLLGYYSDSKDDSSEQGLKEDESAQPSILGEPAKATGETRGTYTSGKLVVRPHIDHFADARLRVGPVPGRSSIAERSRAAGRRAAERDYFGASGAHKIRHGSELGLANAFATGVGRAVNDTSLVERIAEYAEVCFRHDGIHGTLSLLEKAATAMDPWMDMTELRDSINRLVQAYELDLTTELLTTDSADVAWLCRVIASAKLIPHEFHIPVKLLRRRANGRIRGDIGQATSIFSTLDTNEGATLSKEDFGIVQKLILRSDAYMRYKDALFLSVLGIYRQILLSRLEEEARRADGATSMEDSMLAVAYELSFVPKDAVTLMEMHSSAFPGCNTFMDTCKAWVEEPMRET
ncbi:hypothetical protein CLAFUW4_08609 [Fulvia fulva]|uniref:Uncharacterized protein n=1 Tax=Passalora fulva TaxID=5499 RepID=A0A9Q8LCL9_PASFU|nr:uncharacterized protein CLAFUR5_08710 [Fulvia fulva]KAK4629905.1 hypothetical protein CLAFUR0_08607 [Fulvia fulva]UJO14958.1 hypothetical protein CLAFUR5_08710 [Fulvia fulva]WPV13048.1 hypothetical protein CLAFUW4_08609 [Fulvia fulva]